MKCNLCKSHQLKEVLTKGLTNVWTNSTDFEKYEKHKCYLTQCQSCGHVFQPITLELMNTLNEIYSSEENAVSTLPGVGNWGLEMANSNMKYLDNIDIKSINSACEIGCGNDFFLQYLRNQGVNNLLGIDPSFKCDFVEDNVTFKSGFVDSQMNLNKKFDLIYAMNVFEHINDLDEIFIFIEKHLVDNGILFFCVPNCQALLSYGDPALFIHEHINYFTESVLINLLQQNSFKLVSLESTSDTYYITAQKTICHANFDTISITEFNYGNILETKLKSISNHCKGKRVLFHGVCNSLNNILNWGKIEFDYKLADNDDTKEGKLFFGKTVNKPNKQLLSDIDLVYILPLAYADKILDQYNAIGFNGEIKVI
jgi:SAM-dependent methyltransferase